MRSWIGKFIIFSAAALVLNACASRDAMQADAIIMSPDPRVFTVNHAGAPGIDVQKVARLALVKAANAALERDFPYFMVVHKSAEVIDVNDPRHPLHQPDMAQGAVVLRYGPPSLTERRAHHAKTAKHLEVFHAKLTVKLYTEQDARRYGVPVYDARQVATNPTG